jgi:hypothetical protein
MKEALKLEREMKQLREVHAVQGRDGCWDIDDYMLGLYNGLELALSIVENRECRYKNRPKPEQEPVAWGVFDDNLHDMFFAKEEAQEMVRLKGDGSTVKPLYTTPPQRKPLTEWQMFAELIVRECGNVAWKCGSEFINNEIKRHFGIKE